MKQPHRLLTCLLTCSLLVLFVCAAVTLPFSGVQERSLDTGSDELIHLRVAQEMYNSGQYLHPTHSGEPYFNKPPLRMWLQQPMFALLGESNRSFRLVDGVSGVLTAVVTAIIGYRMVGSLPYGLLAGCLLFLNTAWVFGKHGIRRGTVDSVLILCTTLAVWAAWELLGRYVISGRATEKCGKARSWSVWFGLWSGLSVLTKSVIGLLPWCIALPFLFLGVALLPPSPLPSDEATQAHERKPLLSRLYTATLDLFPLLLLAALLTVAVGGWYYAYHFLFSEGAFKRAVGNELVARAVSGFHNRGDRWYYLRQMFSHGLFAPPLVFTAALIYAAAALVWGARLRRVVALFLLVWVAVPTLLLSIPNSRLVWYLGPTYPAGALLIALLLSDGMLFLSGKLRNCCVGASCKGYQPFQRFKWYRDTALALALGILLGGVGLSLIREGVRIREMLFTPTEQSALDLLAEHFDSTLSPTARALEIGRPIPRGIVVGRGRFNPEVIYLNRHRELITRAKSSTPLATFLQGEEYRFALLGESIINTLHALPQGVQSYQLLPPSTVRTAQVLVLSKESEGGAFIGRLERYSCDNRARISEAVGVIEQPGASGAVCYFEGSRVSLFLPGDSLRQQLGSLEELQIGFSERPPFSVIVKVFFNDELVTELPLKPKALESYPFTLRPGLWRRGRNELTLSLYQQGQQGSNQQASGEQPHPYQPQWKQVFLGELRRELPGAPLSQEINN